MFFTRQTIKLFLTPFPFRRSRRGGRRPCRRSAKAKTQSSGPPAETLNRTKPNRRPGSAAAIGRATHPPGVAFDCNGRPCSPSIRRRRTGSRHSGSSAIGSGSQAAKSSGLSSPAATPAAPAPASRRNGKGVGSRLDRLPTPFVPDLFCPRQTSASSATLPSGLRTSCRMTLPRCSMETGSPAWPSRQGAGDANGLLKAIRLRDCPAPPASCPCVSPARLGGVTSWDDSPDCHCNRRRRG